MKTIIKIDLDVKLKKTAIKILKIRFKFLFDCGILHYDNIEKILLVKKNNFSSKVFLNKRFKNERDKIIFMALLGTDFKHLAITFRDYKLGFKNYDRLFNIKRTKDFIFIHSKEFDVTKEVMPFYELGSSK